MLKSWLLICCHGFLTALAQGSLEATATDYSFSTSLLTTKTAATGRATTPASSTFLDTSASETLLRGTYDGKDETTTSSTRSNGTLTLATSTSALGTLTTTTLPTNTQPCNLYVEFCTRLYSNVTYIGTHNSPFVRQSNAAANQELDVETQLNDGIRMLQGQTHMVNNTLYYCHTSCDILNAGTVEDYLTKVAKWIKRNPFEVVTILIGNGDFVDIGNYTDPLVNSGLADIAYVPPKRNIRYNQWPTLSELILTGKRAIVFMDYKADEGIVPYILDEFSYMWETPFSQTDAAFPCTIERPPDQPRNDTEGKLYMANHNLNVEFSFAGQSLLVPNTVAINSTNAVDGPGSLGLQANQCRGLWERYPNFLLVDFYEAGNGSVFEVAAMANNYLKHWGINYFIAF
ncbi:uncharacterized protein H6S33_009614 [Morchella sextelata]|uniref:uncharacterized protein n=1 Tax=Morchella sextelata TaxID=1174677 RepID=UPI001D05A408|nr:uncharacterized protein H6S33_009614 [Morchella sextelata]KAH0613234.1 hypothetical protein H6S33_009614 [Morchella sextelata]